MLLKATYIYINIYRCQLWRQLIAKTKYTKNNIWQMEHFFFHNGEVSIGKNCLILIPFLIPSGEVFYTTVLLLISKLTPVPPPPQLRPPICQETEWNARLYWTLCLPLINKAVRHCMGLQGTQCISWPLPGRSFI